MKKQKIYEIIKFINGNIIKLESLKMLYKGDKIYTITIDELHKFDKYKFVEFEEDKFFKEVGDPITIFTMPLKKNGEPKFTKLLDEL